MFFCKRFARPFLRFSEHSLTFKCGYSVEKKNKKFQSPIDLIQMAIKFLSHNRIKSNKFKRVGHDSFRLGTLIFTVGTQILPYLYCVCVCVCVCVWGGGGGVGGG